MSGFFAGSGQVEMSGSGTTGVLNGAVTVACPAAATLIFVLSGTWAGTQSFEGTADGSVYFPVTAALIPSTASSVSTTVNNVYAIAVGGLAAFRVRTSAYTSGTATVTWNMDTSPNRTLSPAPLLGATDGSVIGNVADSLKTTVTSSALPSGAATEATLVTRATEATLATRASEATLATRASEATLATRLADATFTARINTLGQKTAANSTPVVLASDQSVIPVSMLDTSPANGSITAVDIVTSNLSGANGQVFYFGTPTTNSAAVFSLASQETVMVQANILGGGGTLVVEVSMDGGAFWLRPNVFQISTQSYANSFTLPFIALVNTAGMNQIRVRAITSWSGTATIIARESINTHAVTIADPLPGITGTIVLPNGASTSAIQTTQQTSLSSIDTKLTSQATAANQTTEIAALQLIDDIPTAPNAAVIKGAPMMGQLDDTSTVVATEDNASVIRITAQRGLHANLRSAAGVELLYNGQIPDADVLNTAGQMRAQNATTTAAEALGGATILGNRKCLLITPTAGIIYWGFTSGVTVATGTPIFKNQTFTIAAGPAQHIYIIAASTIDCRIGEAS